MRPPPIGVAVLGFFALVNGLGFFIIGLRLMGIVTFGPAETGSGLFFWGLLTFVLGIAYIAVAWGRRPSASGRGRSACSSRSSASSTP